LPGLDWNPCPVPKFSNSPSKEELAVRKFIFRCIVAALAILPMAGVIKAEETTVIKRDHDRDNTIIKEREGDGDRTVIEKREELNVLPVPHTEEKTIIKKERD
jgi:hypothetical protein